MQTQTAALDALCVNALRFLAADAVEAARSGHPGMPLGAAPVAYVLWDRFLRHNPANPGWFNRDRFILSAGHASALLYALLHLYGYDLPLEELKRFRQWGSRTPGHPEVGLTPGVEATTGPLGQGFAMGVGMALAERFLAARYNRPGFPIVDHYTYALVSDGDLMEGISAEAAALAGHWKLGKLIYLYDDNRVTIEGSTDLAFTEDVSARFRAYGWQVLEVPDGNDLEAVAAALRLARADRTRPSLIRIRTHIGYGSPKQDSPEAHGAPLGPEALRAAKERLGWPVEPPFYVPDQVYAHTRRALERGQAWEGAWRERFEAYRKEYPDLAAELEAFWSGQLPEGWDRDLPAFDPADGSLATRAASGQVLNALARRIPVLLGGSADLAPSNKTLLKGEADQSAEHPEGRNLRFGVREHAMAAIVNGMALHGGVRPYAATFLVFSDYLRPSLRLAALMEVPSIFVFTHDSIGVGEDGPTHQPVEHLPSLRAIPGLTVIRPADANETAAAWTVALGQRGPVALILTRQGVPILPPHPEGVARGGYVLAEAEGGDPQVVLIGTGSEVHLALEARRLLAEKGVRARVVSLPSWELFDAQPEAYRQEVLPPHLPKVAVEAAVPLGWERYVGPRGTVLGLDRFGASAPGKVLFEKFGFTPERVAEAALALIGDDGRGS